MSQPQPQSAQQTPSQPPQVQAQSWPELIDALHALTNTMTVRTHYGEKHPAVAKADDHCMASFARVLERVSPILIAFTDGEFVVCERPFPELRDRLHVLAEALARHEIECVVVHRGMSRPECELLGATLNLSADVRGRVREQAQAKLTHVLFRFLETRVDGVMRRSAGIDATSLVPVVRELLRDVTDAIHGARDIDVGAVTGVAREIRQRCALRSFALESRSVVDHRDDLAAHATNVALLTGALALDAHYPEALQTDLVAAALLHDIGHALLPERIRYVPSPLLAEEDVAAHRDHTIEGATALLLAGCPELWVMTALEHHRGIDGRGYPELGNHAPHELVRVVALASFFDHKRTLLSLDHAEARLHATDPTALMTHAFSLEDRYFGRPLVRRLLRATGAYPPGTTVELSNRAPALVTQANVGDPWRPQVQLLRGEHAGVRIELRDLSSSGMRFELSAVRAIAPPLFALGDVQVAEGAAAATAAKPGRSIDTTAKLPRFEVKTIDEIAADFLAPPPETTPIEAPMERNDEALQAKLLEFLSDPPPPPPPDTTPARPSAIVTKSAPRETTGVSVPPAIGAYSSMPPRITQSSPLPEKERARASVGAYSSRPPESLEESPRAATAPPSSKPLPSAPPVSSRPPISAGSYSTRPDAVTRSKPPSSSAGVYSTKPPQIVERIEKEPVSRPPPSSSRSASPPSSNRMAVARPSKPPEPIPVCIASPSKIAREQGLDSRASFLLSLLDGVTPLSEIADASGLPADDAKRLIDDLVRRGLVAMKE